MLSSMRSSPPMTHDHDRMIELQNHVRDVAEDRDTVLKERDLQSALLRRVALWVKNHAQHPPGCGHNRGGECSCGLKEMKVDLL